MDSRRRALEYLKSIEDDLDNKIQSLESINEQYRLAKKYVLYNQNEQDMYGNKNKTAQSFMKNVHASASASTTASVSGSLPQGEANGDTILDDISDVNNGGNIDPSSCSTDDLGLLINVDNLLLKAKSMKFVDSTEVLETSRSDSANLSQKNVGARSVSNNNSKSSARSVSNGSVNSNRKCAMKDSSKRLNINSVDSKRKNVNVGIKSEARSSKTFISTAVDKKNIETKAASQASSRTESEVIEPEQEEPYHVLSLHQQIECLNNVLAQHCSKSDTSKGNDILNSNIKLINHKYAYHPPAISPKSGVTGPVGKMGVKYPVIDIPRNYAPCVVRYNQLHPMHSTMNNAKLNSVYMNLEFLKKTEHIVGVGGGGAEGTHTTAIDSVSNAGHLKLGDLPVCQPLFSFLQYRHRETSGSHVSPFGMDENLSPRATVPSNKDVCTLMRFIVNESKKVYELLVDIVQSNTVKQKHSSAGVSIHRNHNPLGYQKVQAMMSYWCSLNLYNQILGVLLLMYKDETGDKNSSDTTGGGGATTAVNDSNSQISKLEQEINGLLTLPPITPGTTAIQVEYLLSNAAKGHLAETENLLEQTCSSYHIEVKNKYISTLHMLIGKLCVKPLITEIKDTCMKKPTDENGNISIQQSSAYNEHWVYILKKFKLLRMCFSDKPVYFTLDK